MGRLAQFLQQRLGKPVLDESGLSGAYDFTFDWELDQNEASDAGQPPAAQQDSINARMIGAIEKRLGLKLVSTTGSVPILVVDHVAAPTRN